MTYRSYVGSDAGFVYNETLGLRPDLHDVRHRRPAAHVRRRLHHQRRQHRLHLEPDRPARPTSTASLAIDAGRQPHLPDHLGRRRHRHLRPVELLDQPRHQPEPRATTRSSRRRSSPTSAAARTAATPAATSSTRCSTTATPRSLIENAIGGSGDDRHRRQRRRQHASRQRRQRRPHRRRRQRRALRRRRQRPARRRRRHRPDGRRRRQRRARSAAPAPTR